MLCMLPSPLMHAHAIWSRSWVAPPTCRSLVVLADRDKDQLDAEVARQLNGSGLHYVTRRGAPHCAKVRPRPCWMVEPACLLCSAFVPACGTPLGSKHLGSWYHGLFGLHAGLPAALHRALRYHTLQDLETVAAAHAKTVILLHPDHDPAAGGLPTGQLSEVCRLHWLVSAPLRHAGAVACAVA